MTRLVRGAWSRRGALTTLALMTAVVVGGAVGVLGFAAAAGTSRLLAAPLLLLGAVAVPSIGAELAAGRREEIGLARLRGIHGARLWRFLLLEPLGAILVGTALGVLLGAVVTAASTSLWLGEAADPLDRAAVLTALGTALGGLAIVVVASVAALREPLAVQVATRQRPRRATTVAVFLRVLVIVGAGVAAYRSRSGTTDDPDALVLLGPALVGLGLGQVAIWLLRLGARIATGTTGGRGIAPFLATRRLARADDLVTPLRLVVAAAVVATLAATGAAAVDDWTDTESRIAAAGPTVVPVSGGARSALALTRELDPSRPVGFVNVMLAPHGRCQVSELGDVIMLNRYYGWYWDNGDVPLAEAHLRAEIDAWIELAPGKPIIFTEYGPDTLSGLRDFHHRPWSEEFQTDLLGMYHRVFDDYREVAGEQMWNFADFQTTPGIMRVGGNKKGMFTRDRLPKAAAYSVRERWLRLRDEQGR